jgi:short-subunit dehydrogenase
MLARGSGVVVNNASISAYAHLPAASTYAAVKLAAGGPAALIDALAARMFSRTPRA